MHYGCSRHATRFAISARTAHIVKEMILRRDIYRGDSYKRYRDLVFEANYRAGSRYIPTDYPGRILLLLAGNFKVGPELDTRLVWCELARDGCHVVRIPASDLGELPEEASRKYSRRQRRGAISGVV